MRLIGHLATAVDDSLVVSTGRCVHASLGLRLFKTAAARVAVIANLLAATERTTDVIAVLAASRYFVNCSTQSAFIDRK